MAEIRSTCCYCGVGCGVIIETELLAGQPRIVGVRGDPEHPANFGRLCSKGSSLHLTVAPETLAARALLPELRDRLNKSRTSVSWDVALDHATERFAAVIERYGPDSVAFYVSGQLLTEDYHAFNKLVRGLIGTNNIDSNSRLCMSSASAGYKATLGADAPPCNYEDTALTDCLLVAGANPSWAHPVLFRRIEEARRANPALRMIVIDPRRTETAAAADLHLAIRPGSDVFLYNAMLNVLIEEGRIDPVYIERHTEGYSALAIALREFTPAQAARRCGLGLHGANDIIKAARMFGSAPRALSLYCQGVNQSTHGVANNGALINLHLATGKIGRPGCGPFSLTGQPNAMGGRETGALAPLLPGHREVANADHRAEVARLWGVPSLPATPGKTAVEMFAALKQGTIKAVWIVGSNPAQSMPDAGSVRDALRAAEFVVVQDAYANTDTTAYADLLLPAASWGEKEGVVTNSERRISRVRAAIAPPGEARTDWSIAADFARRLGARLGKAELAQRMFGWTQTTEIFDEHRAATLGRDLDIGGLTYAILERDGPQQWPYPTGAAAGTSRLFGDGQFCTASRRARFANVANIGLGDAALAEDVDVNYPLHLTSGRLRDQWHGMSRTGTVPRLCTHQPEPLLEMDGSDMARLHVVDGDLVRVSSRRGALTVRVQASETLRPGLTFMAMHWGSQQMTGIGVNVLTTAAFDPDSRQPELKHAAIRVEKLAAIGRKCDLVALRRAAPGADPALVLALQARLQPWLARFEYATLTLAGRDDPVLVLRAYGAPLPVELLAQLDAELGFDSVALQARMLSFSDSRRKIMKRALIEDDVLTGVRLAGEAAACDWLIDLMARAASAQEVRPWLLAPLIQPPMAGKPRGRVICNCFDVAENEIAIDIAAGLALSALQDKHKCGTSCGSCLPELQHMLRAVQPGA